MKKITMKYKDSTPCKLANCMPEITGERATALNFAKLRAEFSVKKYDSNGNYRIVKLAPVSKPVKELLKKYKLWG